MLNIGEAGALIEKSGSLCNLDKSQRIYAVKINLRKLKFTYEGR